MSDEDGVPAPPNLLTEEERRALDLTGELAGLFSEIVGAAASRPGDLAEIVAAIHLLQRYLMSQAAARAFPGQYRALGGHPLYASTPLPMCEGPSPAWAEIDAARQSARDRFA